MKYQLATLGTLSAGGWALYRKSQRAKLARKIEELPKVRTFRDLAKKYPAIVKPKDWWLFTPEGVQGKVDSIILYTNTVTADAAFEALSPTIPMLKEPSPEDPESADILNYILSHGTDKFEEFFGFKVPDQTVEQVQAKVESQESIGTTTSWLNDLVDSVQGGQQATPNPRSVEWDKFLGKLN